MTCFHANSAPFLTSSVTGPVEAEQDSLCAFAVSLGDAENDSVCVRFAWDEGDTSEWSAYGVPGTSPFQMTHAWDSSGTYHVSAQGRDSHGAVSVWSSDHPVTVVSAYPWRVTDTFEVTGTNDAFALLPSGELLYVTAIGQATIFLVRTADHSVIGQIDIGEQRAFTVSRRVIAPENCAFAYVIGYDEEALAAIRTSDNSVAAVMSDIHPAGITVSADGARLYVPAVLQNHTVGVVVYSTFDNAPIDTIMVPWTREGFIDVVVRPDGRFLYLADDHGLLVVDLERGIVSDSLSLNWPGPLVVTPDGSRLYVVEWGGTVVVVNTDDCSVAARISVGAHKANCIAILPSGDYVYLGGNGGEVTLIRTSCNAVVRRASLNLDDLLGMESDSSGNTVYAVWGGFVVLRR